MNVKMIATVCAAFIVMAGITGCADSKYLAEKQLYYAEKEAKSILTKDPASVTGDQYDRLIALYRKVVDTAPLEDISAKAQFVIADIHTMQGKYREAQEELLEIIRNFNAKQHIASQAQLGIGKLYEAQGKWDAAMEEYEKLMDQYPLSNLGLNMPLYIVRYYQSKNDSASEQRAYERGIRHYEKVIQEFTGTDAVAGLKSYLAAFQASQGKYSEAISTWNGIISDSPGGTEAMQAYLAKAETYGQALKDAPAAIKAYEEFVSLYPRYEKLDEIKVRMGILYSNDKQPEKARKVFEEILAEYGDDENTAVRAYLGLAYCYKNEANPEKVGETYALIKEKYPNSKATLTLPFLLGQCYEELQIPAKAQEAYTKAIQEYESILAADDKREDAKKEAANLLALCYVKNKETSKALQLLRTLSDRYPKEPMYLLDMASLYVNLNAGDKAIKVYEEVIARYPDNRFVTQLAASQIQNLQKK